MYLFIPRLRLIVSLDVFPPPPHRSFFSHVPWRWLDIQWKRKNKKHRRQFKKIFLNINLYPSKGQAPCAADAGSDLSQWKPSQRVPGSPGLFAPVYPFAGLLVICCCCVQTPAAPGKKPCYLLAALCSASPVLLLNTGLFSISTIYNSHAAASNIEQRDGAERSGGSLPMYASCTLFTNPRFSSPSSLLTRSSQSFA